MTVVAQNLRDLITLSSAKRPNKCFSVISRNFQLIQVPMLNGSMLDDERMDAVYESRHNEDNYDRMGIMIPLLIAIFVYRCG